jgi:excisionase family DNA binding protein
MMSAATDRPRRLVTVKEAWTYAKMGRSRFYELMAVGTFAAYKSGSRTLVDLDTVDTYLDNLPRKPERSGGPRRD